MMVAKRPGFTLAPRGRGAGKPPRGLTLIELMIALAISVVLMSLAVPSMQSLLQRQRLKTAAHNLATDLAEARFEAARRGQTMHVVYATGADWCYALATTSGCDCRVAQSCRLKSVQAGDARGVQLVEAQPMAFDPTGGASLGERAALLQASGRSERLSVVLSALGRARVCAPDGALAQIPGC